MNKVIGARIRLYRRGKQLSQQQLADKLELSNAALSKIENGITDLTINRLHQIAEALEMPAVELFDGCQLSMSDETRNLYERSISSLKDDTILLQKKVIQLQDQLNLKS